MSSIAQIFLGQKHKRQTEINNSNDSNSFENTNKIKKIENNSETQLLDHSKKNQISFSEFISENKELKIENDVNKIIGKEFCNTIDVIENKLEIQVDKSLNKINNEKNKTIKKIDNILRTSIKKLEKNEEKIKVKMKEIPEKIKKDLQKNIQEEESLYFNKLKNENNNELNNEIHEGIKCSKCFDGSIIRKGYINPILNNFNLCQKYEKENPELSIYPHKFLEFDIKQGSQISKEKNNDYKINNIIILNEDKSENSENLLEGNNNFDNKKLEDILNKKDINEKKQKNNNIIDSHIIINEMTEFDNYSYLCLTKNLYFSVNKRTKEHTFNLILKNNGIFPWPRKNTFLIKDSSLSNNIDVDKIFLEPLNPNNQDKIDIIFKNMENLLPGKYNLYLDFIVKNKNFGEKILIIVKILENKEYELNQKVSELEQNF